MLRRLWSMAVMRTAVICCLHPSPIIFTSTMTIITITITVVIIITIST
jgi:hypothetical protein